MLFRKRDGKKPDERVLELKARVEALRQPNESDGSTGHTLDQFLMGDDVRTGDVFPTEMSGPRLEALPPDAPASGEVDFAAELAKYLRRQEELGINPGGEGQPPKPDPRIRPASLDGSPAKNDQTQSVALSNHSMSPDETPPAVDGKEQIDADRPERAGEMSVAAQPVTEPDGSASRWPDSSQWPSEETWPPASAADDEST